MTRAAVAKPRAAMRVAHSGTMTTPPAAAPFIAMLTARPRFRSNQGATSVLMAAPLVAAHPTAITPKATNNCLGVLAQRPHRDTHHPARAATLAGERKSDG